MSDLSGFGALYTKRLWEQFTRGQEIARDALPDYVYTAWTICRDNKLNPKDIPEPRRLSRPELEALRQRYATLLEISHPVLDMIKISTSITRPIVILTAADGVILDVAGDESSLSAQEAFYNAPGVAWDDSFMGPRATTLTIREKKPLSLMGYEHYFEIFHDSLCYAAPIFDHNKNIVASISIATSLKKYHPHTMAMLTAAAENISMQLQKRDAEYKKNYLSSLIYSICNALPEGIVALDMNNAVTYINDAAETIFAQPFSSLAGKQVTEFIHKTSKDELMRAIALRKQSNVTVHIKDKSIENKYLCRIQPLFGHGNATVGMTLFLASDKQVAKGITHVGGNRAYYQFEDILGNSLKLQHCVQLAKKVAKKATRVLITGESGTGKELFAQAIHNASPRRSGPFVAISCASIPRELVEAELFGYVAGAFTGASKSGAMGKFELAQNGTLFLDEINSLPMEAQGKLLRALQQNEIVRVGGTTPIPVNAHVITATNVSLPELVASKRFREDLLYRINSVEVRIPPLRERPGDAEVLIQYFIGKLARSQNRQVRISSSWLNAMLQHVWSGNVRELENACEYSMILCEGDTLQTKHLPAALGGRGESVQAAPVCEHVDDAYKKWLSNALQACGGNISEASARLGISRGTLYRKMKKYALDSDDFRFVKED